MTGEATAAQGDRTVEASTTVRAVAAVEPDRLAIAEPTPLTYGDLDRRADRMANGLVQRVGPGAHRIALRFESLRDLVLSGLAVRRCGMVAVNIDPTAPAERLRFLLDDSGASLMISDVERSDDPGDWPVVAPASLEVDLDRPFVDVDQAHDDPAMIIFTSGSTGLPKGILHGPERKRAIHQWLPTRIDDIDSLYRMAAVTAGSVGPVDTLIEIAIGRGKTMYPYDIRSLGLHHMAEWILDQQIDVLPLIPTIARFLVPTLEPGFVLEPVRVIAFFGEQLNWEDVRDLRPHLPRPAVIHNVYGTTEGGILATNAVTSITPLGTGPVPPGQPIPGYEVTIIDEAGREVPHGETGEITVASHEVGLGYWRRPDLTRAAFETLPGGRRRSRTGDAGRRLPDGSIELLGRLDHMVKVSGNRIELGEVETALRGVDGVAASAAATHPDGQGDVRLWGYATPAASIELDPVEVRAALSRRIPGYMIPYRIVVLDELPMLPGGKVDRSKLPADVPDQAPRPRRAAESEQLEQALTSLWADILELPTVGVDDDFFDAGGDSMRAVRLFTEIERTLGIDRPASLILEAPTISQLARALVATPVHHGVLLPVRPEGSRPPLFLVHGGRGDILWARGVAESIGEDQPVYGVQPPPLDVLARVSTFEELCQLYVRAIEPVARDTPAMLFGFSYGGIVAFEMALQLQRAGRDVGLLALGDITLNDHLLLDAAGNRIPRSRLKELRGLPPHRAAMGIAALALREPSAVVKWARRTIAARIAPPEDRGPTAMPFLHGLGQHYRPSGRFEGEVLVLRAGWRDRDDDLGWGEFVSGPVEVVDVPGGHRQLLDPPYVATSAAALRTGIDRALSRL